MNATPQTRRAIYLELLVMWLLTLIAIRVVVSVVNAGLPELVGADFVYNGTPDGMGDLARLLKDLGVDVVGSCCGSTPEHTAVIRSVMVS